MSRLLNLLIRITKLPAVTLIFIVRIYQWFISPLIGRNCRFHPSCSQYFVQAVEKYGAVSGTLRGLRRIARCHPWNPGGYDPP
ncbi:MAG: membrane protein insertion efficiency factor YidD [Planctomycetaceae bacterium]|nr:membrane protein insertion efficiency factor YidD [Planctomycetaceae bacterium]